MKRIFGLLALTALILSISLVLYLLASPLLALVYTPYLVLTTALTLSFSIAYFFTLNDVSSRLLNIVVYLVSFVPTIIPLIACFDADFMELYWRNYLSLTFLQLGVGVLSASLFFKKPGINFSNVCSAISSMILFIFGILIILEAGILGSFSFLITTAILISLLFLIGLGKRLKEV